MERLLANERVTAEGADPERWLYVLHGIYGAGRNWGSVARALVQQKPEWGAVLIDLRQHGASQGFPPPHTLAAAAADLERLAAATVEPAAVLGHSFGGKVALQYAAAVPAGLEQVWVIDSTPSAREPGGSAWQMLTAVKSMPDRFASRDEAVEAIVTHGFEPAVARWMATNLERDGDTLRWRFQLDAMEALLLDFFRTDLWHVIEREDGPFVHIVKADQSSVLSADDERRARAAESTGRVAWHEVASGHWVNADNPGALLELFSTRLR